MDVEFGVLALSRLNGLLNDDKNGDIARTLFDDDVVDFVDAVATVASGDSVRDDFIVVVGLPRGGLVLLLLCNDEPLLLIVVKVSSSFFSMVG